MMPLGGIARWRGLGILVVLLILVVGTIARSAAPLATSTSVVWVGDKSSVHLIDPGTLDVVQTIPIADSPKALAIDPHDQSLWVLIRKQILKFDKNTSLKFDIDLKDINRDLDHARFLSLNPFDSSVWVVGKNTVIHLDASGQPLAQSQIKNKIRAAAFSLDETLWLLTRDQLIQISAQGAVLQQRLIDDDFDADSDNDGIDDPRELVVDSAGGLIWVIDRTKLYQFSLANLAGVPRSIDLPRSTSETRLIALNPFSGQLFIATKNQLLAYDRTVTLQSTTDLKPFNFRTLKAFAFEPTAQDLWLIGVKTLAHFSSAGALINKRTLDRDTDTLGVASGLLLPQITVLQPLSGSLTNNPKPVLRFGLSALCNSVHCDLDSGYFRSFTINATLNQQALTANQFVINGNEATFTPINRLPEGLNTITALATDGFKHHSDSVISQFTIDTIALSFTELSPADGLITQQAAQMISGKLSEPALVTINGTPILTDANNAFSRSVTLMEGANTYTIVAQDPAGNVAQRILHLTLTTWVGGLPPDPTTVAPALDLTVTTTLANATAFLYSGTNPVQIGIAPGTIEVKRVAVVRGKVLTRDNAPLSGVQITVLNHPEFGQTLSRADSEFDMVVNGGGYLTINYTKAGYLPVQRQVRAPWQDYVIAPNVVMIPVDTQATTINLTVASPMQVARGSMVSDQDGVRQATLLFPQGTAATMVRADGTTQALSSLTVRATEYTVGPSGPKAMPGELPPTSGYTYAVEYSVDEALAAGAKTVQFNQPVYQYVDNFLNFPIGTAVPVAFYDRDRAAWVPSPNGRIVKILSVANGIANLDINGSNSAADDTALAAINVTLVERVQLASLYPIGKGLWRVPIPHFSAWDSNWGVGPPQGAAPPKVPDPGGPPSQDKPDCQAGSIIECQNQSLGESVPVVGTAFTLNYKSNRMPGYNSLSISIPLSGPTLPPGVKRIDLEVNVAGRQSTLSFPANPNQHFTFVWDGMDAYGRLLQGAQPAWIRVGYVYDAAYRTPADLIRSFGYNGNGLISSNPARTEMTLWKESRATIGSWHTPAVGLGGWTLSVQQAYDSNRQILYLGNGRTRSVQSLYGIIVNTVAGRGIPGFFGDGGPATAALLGGPSGLALDAQGSLYIADTLSHRVRKVTPDGTITTVAGNGQAGFSGDGGPATEATFTFPHGLALDAQGNLYIGDSSNHRVRKVTPDGLVNTVAGNGQRGFSGDGGPATAAMFEQPSWLALDAQGSLYITDVFNRRVRKVTPDGLVNTVAGNSQCCFSGDGGPATEATFSLPAGLALDAQGNLYITDFFNRRVRKVTPDGLINTVAGSGIPGFSGFSGDGGPATAALLDGPTGLTLDAQGSLYIADGHNNRVRKVSPDGIINTVAGNGVRDFSGDGGPATAAEFTVPHGLALDAQGNLYIGDSGNNRVRKLSRYFPTIGSNDFIISSEDGAQLYHFNPTGRHLRTLSSVTGAEQYRFSYDANGYLIQVTDGDGNTTNIERSSSGNPLAIVSPDGQRTVLVLDANGYLATITNPANEVTKMTYTADGLLTALTNRRNQTSAITYDAMGRLTKDQNAAGGFWSTARTDIDTTAYEVSMTSALGHVNRYKVESLTTGDTRRTNTQPDGTVVTTLQKTDGTTQTTSADGTVSTTVQGPDPRFGMQAPLISNTVKLPSDLTSISTTSRSVNLSDPGNLLSLVTETTQKTINSNTTTATYNANTKQTTVTSPVGRQVLGTSDTQGHITQQQIAGLTAINYAYDARGRLSTVSQGAGVDQRTATLSYNAQGFLGSLTDPANRSQAFTYDAVGRMKQQTLADGRVIQYNYDANGNVTSVTPAGRPAHTFTYTPVDQESVYTPPAAGIGSPATQYSYNLNKQLTSIIRPDGQVITFNYEPSGRPSSTVLPDRTVSYGYNAAGQLASVTTPSSTIGYTYDGFLPKNEIWSGAMTGTVSRTYNNDFNVSGISVNGASISFDYDQDQLLTQAGALNIGRSPLNGLVTSTGLNNTSTSQSYTPFGELNQFTASQSGSSVFDVQYTRDKLGRITQKTEVVTGQTDVFDYAYDQGGRLTQVKKNGSVQTSYSYDDNGNRLSKTDGSGTTSGTYDDQDRLLTYGGNTYTYSDNGELKTKTVTGQTTSYVYDVLGNLKQVTLPSGTTIDYIIDGKNRRIGKKINGTSVQGFLFQDNLRPIAELDGSNNVVSRFVYGSKPNVPDYLIKGGNTYRIVSDHLGSPRLVIDTSTGIVQQRLDYDEFGNVIWDSNPGFQPFGFAGGLYDRDTKLTRFGARDYDPETGRWAAKDPVRFAAGDMNLYGYVLSDPINKIDPLGLFSAADLPMLPQGFVDFSAGLGDALLLGFGDDLRDLAGIDGGVDPCSDAYRYGGWASFAGGGARLGYAAIAKGYSVLASSGAAASAFRTELKNAFRLGAGEGWRQPDLTRYATDAELRAAAGRTNPYLNGYGAGVAAAGAAGESGCGCSR